LIRLNCISIIIFEWLGEGFRIRSEIRRLTLNHRYLEGGSMEEYPYWRWQDRFTWCMDWGLWSRRLLNLRMFKEGRHIILIFLVILRGCFAWGFGRFRRLHLGRRDRVGRVKIYCRLYWILFLVLLERLFLFLTSKSLLCYFMYSFLGIPQKWSSFFYIFKCLLFIIYINYKYFFLIIILSLF
jgi:hypothetical protein